MGVDVRQGVRYAVFHINNTFLVALPNLGTKKIFLFIKRRLYILTPTKLAAFLFFITQTERRDLKFLINLMIHLTFCHSVSFILAISPQL